MLLTETKKDYRKDLMKSMEASHLKLINVVGRFNDKVAVEPINRDDLESYPYGRWIPVNSKIQIKKRKNRFGNLLSFDTKMSKGAEFGEHFHDDLIESTEVMSGELLDTLDGKLYKSGDVAHYERGVKHTPIALEDTMLHVLFKP